MRHVELVVISDVHLGTAASRAAELNAYLKSIQPQRLILCGDIVDLWHLRKGIWSEAQTKVIRRILKFANQGIPVHYIIGNHDASMRRYGPLHMGQIELCEHKVLDLNGTRTWFVHGDIADFHVGTPRWLAWLGSHSYDVIESVSSSLNRVQRMMGMRQFSLNQVITKRIGAAKTHISRFERTMARFAAERDHDAVVCGHIHIPADKTFAIDGRPIRYLNSGDWVDSLSALEYGSGAWKLIRWDDMLRTGMVESPISSNHRSSQSLPSLLPA